MGIKYDLLKGKLSGSLSFFRIRRENAAYKWHDAPFPAYFARGINNDGLVHNANAFSPGNADINTYLDAPALSNQFRPRTYQIAVGYLERAFEEAGVPLPVSQKRSDTTGELVFDSDGNPVYAPQPHDFAAYGGILGGGGAGDRPYSDGVYDQWYLVNYEQLRTDGNGMFAEPIYNAEGKVINAVYSVPISETNRTIMRRAFEMALNNEPVYEADPTSPNYGQLVEVGGSGIKWDAFNSDENNNASINGSRIPTITFADETIGIDGQLIFSPTKNYQLVFEFSHQNREIVGRGFNMVDPIAQDTGINWGTEYDKWSTCSGLRTSKT